MNKPENTWEPAGGKPPRVSVLIPLYNSEKHIAETIRSVLDQTFQDFEIVVCDDGSTDGSADVVRGFADPRIRLLENGRNMSSPVTRNRLVREARGELCAVLDSDDLCYPYRLQVQVDYLDSHPEVDVCSGVITFIKENGRKGRPLYTDFESHDEIRVRTLFDCAVAQTTLMFRRERFLASGAGYIERGNGADDMGLYSRAVDLLRFGNIPVPLVKYRRWKGQMSSSIRGKQHGNATESILYRFEAMGFELSEEEKKLLRDIHTRQVSAAQKPLFRAFTYRLLAENAVRGNYDQDILRNHLLRLYRRALRRKIKKTRPALYIPYLAHVRKAKKIK